MSFDPDQLTALAAILRMGSFDRAAQSLGVTQSAVSQRLKALEERAGTSLVHRGQPCTGTDAGIRLARLAQDIDLLQAQVLRDIRPDLAHGHPHVRIAVNADSLGTWLVAALAACPDLMFDLVIDDQDHSTDWLRRGSVHAAVTALEKPVTGCDSKYLGRLRYVATASPAFCKSWFGAGVSSQTLAAAPMLRFSEKDRLQANWMQQVTGRRLDPPAHILPSTHAFVDAACAGLGWGMNPEALVRDLIRQGRLVALIPDQPFDTPLYWQISRLMAPALEPLTSAMLGVAKSQLYR